MQLVRVLFNGNKSDPVSDLVFLQVTFGQVLQVFTREDTVSSNNNDFLTVFFNSDVVTQVTDTTFDLDVVNQVLGVRGWVKDTIVSWGRNVNDELLDLLRFLGGL